MSKPPEYAAELLVLKKKYATPRKLRTSSSKQVDPTLPPSIIVAKFGGCRKMATDTGIPHSTIWRWLVQGDIPTKRVLWIKQQAVRLGVELLDSDFVRQLPV